LSAGGRADGIAWGSVRRRGGGAPEKVTEAPDGNEESLSGLDPAADAARGRGSAERAV